ncbi:hypothetical protein SCHPADRAFT_948068 [Schizopora paradoxa]|uniref:Uncharacterized protein n=1 Tax=Schizopora paradoxa TaxID=27342 RepID=A0A0H2QXE6_9AGAM|nr:hypothetical protein SCHPADRAFT_948068 [Schizopora paradoxa]
MNWTLTPNFSPTKSSNELSRYPGIGWINPRTPTDLELDLVEYPPPSDTVSLSSAFNDSPIPEWEYGELCNRLETLQMYQYTQEHFPDLLTPEERIEGASVLLSKTAGPLYSPPQVKHQRAPRTPVWTRVTRTARPTLRKEKSVTQSVKEIFTDLRFKPLVLRRPRRATGPLLHPHPPNKAIGICARAAKALHRIPECPTQEAGDRTRLYKHSPDVDHSFDANCFAVFSVMVRDEDIKEEQGDSPAEVLVDPTEMAKNLSPAETRRKRQEKRKRYIKRRREREREDLEALAEMTEEQKIWQSTQVAHAQPEDAKEMKSAISTELVWDDARTFCGAAETAQLSHAAAMAKINAYSKIWKTPGYETHQLHHEQKDGSTYQDTQDQPIVAGSSKESRDAIKLSDSEGGSRKGDSIATTPCSQSGRWYSCTQDLWRSGISS